MGGEGCPERDEGIAREKERPQERQNDGEGACGNDRTCVRQWVSRCVRGKKSKEAREGVLG